jgi:hypothetical protein
MEIVTKLECLDFSKDYVLTLTQIECGYPGWEARPVDDFFG